VTDCVLSPGRSPVRKPCSHRRSSLCSVSRPWTAQRWPLELSDSLSLHRRGLKQPNRVRENKTRIRMRPNSESDLILKSDRDQSRQRRFIRLSLLIHSTEVHFSKRHSPATSIKDPIPVKRSYRM
jgi:hypothetical protein